MKAIRVHEYGASDVLQTDEIPMPEPGSGEVRIKIEFAGLNYIDTYQRSGQYKIALPFIPGSEAGGSVDALGAGVEGLKAGDRVAYSLHPAAYAEYAVVPAWKLVTIPDEVDTPTATAAMLQGMTAHYLSHDTYPIRPGDTVLVHAAAGGVGRLLVQMSKMRGARVIGTVSTAEKADHARRAGADDLILYTEVDFETEVKRLTDGRGVDVVYDSVGRPTFHKSLNCLRPRGYLVLYGQAGGAVEPFDPQILNQKGSLFLTRPSLGYYAATAAEIQARADDIFSWIAQGRLEVLVDRVFPLAEAAAAHRYIEARKTMGKVLLSL